MQNKKPVYLNLFQFSFPLTAIVSILHRLSGILLFILIPIFIYALDLVLTSKETYKIFIGYLNANICVQFVIWVFAVSFFYHMLAGVRHLLMDFGNFETKLSANISSKIVFVLAIIFAIWIGTYLWVV